MLLAFLEVAVEARPIGPRLDSLSVIKIISPFADVALFAIHGLKEAETVGLVVLPRALICVAIRAPELTLTVRLIILPFTFVFGLVRPALHSITKFLAFCVNVARVKRILHHFDVFHILKPMLLNHLTQLDNLLTRSTVELFEIVLTCCNHLLLFLQA